MTQMSLAHGCFKQSGGQARAFCLRMPGDAFRRTTSLCWLLTVMTQDPKPPSSFDRLLCAAVCGLTVVALILVAPLFVSVAGGHLSASTWRRIAVACALATTSAAALGAVLGPSRAGEFLIRVLGGDSKPSLLAASLVAAGVFLGWRLLP